MEVFAVPADESVALEMELCLQLPQSVHTFKPALDFVDQVLYLTLPYSLDGQSKGMVLTSQKEGFRLSMDKLALREFTLPNTLVAREDGQVYILAPTKVGRWSQRGVRRFLSGRASVEPCELFEHLQAILAELVWLEDARWYPYLAALVMVSYLKPVFATLPVIGINGPAESGKTRLLEVLEVLCFNGQFASSLTPASMARTIERDQVTLLVDEAEELHDYNTRSELYKILRACYKASGRRIVASRHPGEVLEYSVYALSFVVNIAGFNSALMTRIVPILMKRNRQMPPRIFPHQQQQLQALRDRLYCFAMQYASEVSFLYDNTAPMEALQGRDYEVWVAPLTVAALVEASAGKSGLVDELLSLAQEVVCEKRRHEAATSLDAVVLAGTCEYLRLHSPGHGDTIVAQELCDFLVEQQRVQLKTQQVGAILRRQAVFRTSPRRKWVPTGSGSVQRVCYDIDAAKLEQAVAGLMD